jgi:hypothetical protein
MVASTQLSADLAKRRWLFVHVLAAVTAVTASLLFVLALLGPLNQAMAQFLFSLPIRVLLMFGMFTIIWFWVRMLVDFFRERPTSHPVLWGFLVTLGSYLGALAYFWLVWRPRNRVRDSLG